MLGAHVLLHDFDTVAGVVAKLAGAHNASVHGRNVLAQAGVVAKDLVALGALTFDTLVDGVAVRDEGAIQFGHVRALVTSVMVLGEVMRAPAVLFAGDARA